MRVRHDIRDHNKPAFKASLDKFGIRYKAKRVGGLGQSLDWDCFELIVYDDDPLWPRLRDLAVEHGVRVFSSAIFTTDDIVSADWSLAYATADAGYPQPEDVFGYPPEAFDLTCWCPHCGIGRVQTGPIRLKGEPKSKTAHFFAPQWQHQVLLARQEIRAVFEASGVSGASYVSPVTHRTGAAIESIFQIIPTVTLGEGLVGIVQERVACSPYEAELQLIKRPSGGRNTLPNGYCGRIKYHVPYGRLLVHYSRGVFAGSPDIALSYEWFGSGASSSQQVIVSNKVARLVLAHKWKGLRLQPIELV